MDKQINQFQINSKKAIVPYLLIFVATLVSSMIIYIAHSQSQDLKNNSLYLESEKINAKFNLMKNEVKHTILHSNALAQEELTSKFIEEEINEEKYRKNVLDKINRTLISLNELKYFSSSQLSLDADSIKINIQETLQEISITKELTFEYLKYEDKFFEQISSFKTIKSQITPIQKKNTSCNSPIEDDSCLKFVSSTIEKENDNIACQANDSTNIKEFECFYTTPPFSISQFNIEGLESERNNDPPQINQNIIKYSDSQQDNKIFLNQLPFKEDEKLEFIVFFIPHDIFFLPQNNYNVEEALKIFKTTLLKTVDAETIKKVNDLNEKITQSNFKEYLIPTDSSFNDESTDKTYQASIDEINLYFKIIEQDNIDVISLNSINRFFNLSNNFSSIVITDNLIFDDTSMYQRSVEINIPRANVDETNNEQLIQETNN